MEGEGEKIEENKRDRERKNPTENLLERQQKKRSKVTTATANIYIKNNDNVTEHHRALITQDIFEAAAQDSMCLWVPVCTPV